MPSNYLKYLAFVINPLIVAFFYLSGALDEVIFRILEPHSHTYGMINNSTVKIESSAELLADVGFIALIIGLLVGWFYEEFRIPPFSVYWFLFALTCFCISMIGKLVAEIDTRFMVAVMLVLATHVAVPVVSFMSAKAMRVAGPLGSHTRSNSTDFEDAGSNGQDHASGTIFTSDTVESDTPTG